jgi:hypothetical protein
MVSPAGWVACYGKSLLGRWMFRFDDDDTAFFTILDNLFPDEAMAMDPFAVRIVQQVESIWATFLYYQETGTPFETSFHESLRRKMAFQYGYRALRAHRSSIRNSRSGPYLIYPVFTGSYGCDANSSVVNRTCQVRPIIFMQTNLSSFMFFAQILINYSRLKCCIL